MDNLTNLLIAPDMSLKEALAVLDLNGVHICLVVDDQRKLLGTLTDGDIRRTILVGGALDQRVDHIMNRTPHVGHEDASSDELKRKMLTHKITQIPVLDDRGYVIRLETLAHLMEDSLAERPNWVVLMAGGLGTRLRPLTDDRPKPMLEVGDKPILENIIEKCVRQNFKKFYISVNYKAEMIVDYFGDGARFGIEIRYLHETQRMGTAGSLGLIQERPSSPLLVMNADLLTDMRLDSMLKYHEEHAAIATMGVREYDFQVPFGVVETDDSRVVEIDEKPVHKFFVNAGIYAIAPNFLDRVPANKYLDMPDLLNEIATEGQKVVAFPVIERWLDVGRFDDYKRAQSEALS